MKIECLGSKGAEEGNKHHQKNCGILVKYLGQELLFDIGETEFLDRKPDFAFLTHTHDNHVNGLKGVEKRVFIPIYIPSNIIDEVKEYPVDSWRKLDLRKPKRIDDFIITPYSVLHSITNRTCLYRIEASGTRIIYAPNFLEILNKKILHNVDLFIGDGTSLIENVVTYTGKKKEGSLSMKNQLLLVKDYKIPSIYFIHLGREVVQLSDEEIIERLKPFSNGIDVNILRDGEEIEIGEFDFSDIENKIPSPRKGESEQDYVSRCIPAVKEVDPKRPQKQVIAICYTTYRRSKGKLKKEEDDINTQVEGEKIITIELDEETIEFKEWTYAYKKSLPDSAYAHIDPGAEKDPKTGHTVQSARHLPYKDKNGNIDRGHLAAALQAIGGARTGKVPPYASKAKGKLCTAARKIGMKSSVCKSRKMKKDICHHELDCPFGTSQPKLFAYKYPRGDRKARCYYTLSMVCPFEKQYPISKTYEGYPYPYYEKFSKFTPESIKDLYLEKYMKRKKHEKH